ncbi:inner membrane protein [Photobacterium aphoticum]|uniref:Inner membrane protein n=1 Tax=Photobacterium aphoticum TaxID=754436 RepID=A0A090R5Y2_9GAMM|nr:inner membrane protein [Photobacterium aphoticum]
MPISEGMNLALMLSESGIIDNAIHELMMQPQVMMAAESNPGIKSAMKRQINKWRGQVQQRITKVSVEDQFQREISLYQEVSQWEPAYFREHVHEAVKQLEGQSTYYFKAKSLLDKDVQKQNPMFQQFFCHQWYQHLTQALTEAQMNELEQHKEKLLSDLYQRIETMQQMDEVTEAGDETKAGRLWDMAKAS